MSAYNFTAINVVRDCSIILFCVSSTVPRSLSLPWLFLFMYLVDKVCFVVCTPYSNTVLSLYRSCVFHPPIRVACIPAGGYFCPRYLCAPHLSDSPRFGLSVHCCRIKEPRCTSTSTRHRQTPLSFLECYLGLISPRGSFFSRLPPFPDVGPQGAGVRGLSGAARHRRTLRGRACGVGLSYAREGMNHPPCCDR